MFWSEKLTHIGIFLPKKEYGKHSQVCCDFDRRVLSNVLRPKHTFVPQKNATNQVVKQQFNQTKSLQVTCVSGLV